MCLCLITNFTYDRCGVINTTRLVRENFKSLMVDIDDDSQHQKGNHCYSHFYHVLTDGTALCYSRVFNTDLNLCDEERRFSAALKFL